MNCWHPFTVRVPEEIDPANPRYENGIDFVLTPQERSQTAIISCDLRRRRDRLSKAEEAREAKLRG